MVGGKNQELSYLTCFQGDQPVTPANVSGDIISQFKTLQEINFLGEWDSSTPGNKLFSNFESSTGKIRLNFFNELADTVKMPVIIIEFANFFL